MCLNFFKQNSYRLARLEVIISFRFLGSKSKNKIYGIVYLIIVLSNFLIQNPFKENFFVLLICPCSISVFATEIVCREITNMFEVMKHFEIGKNKGSLWFSFSNCWTKWFVVILKAWHYLTIEDITRLHRHFLPHLTSLHRWSRQNQYLKRRSICYFFMLYIIWMHLRSFKVKVKFFRKSSFQIYANMLKMSLFSHYNNKYTENRVKCCHTRAMTIWKSPI